MLAHYATAILGQVSLERSTCFTATMPAEASENPWLIHALLAQGMQIMRFNRAHGASMI